jgi:hypothetical protein
MVARSRLDRPRHLAVMYSVDRPCRLICTVPATVKPGARDLHRKFRWSQPITAFSGGRIGGGGPLVVRAPPAQLVGRWWLQPPLRSSLYMRYISLQVARNPDLYHPLLLCMSCPSRGTRQAQTSTVLMATSICTVAAAAAQRPRERCGRRARAGARRPAPLSAIGGTDASVGSSAGSTCRSGSTSTPHRTRPCRETRRAKARKRALCRE